MITKTLFLDFQTDADLTVIYQQRIPVIPPAKFRIFDYYMDGELNKIQIFPNFMNCCKFITLVPEEQWHYVYCNVQYVICIVHN